jgi:GH25 family lysozyme M1 (1,4-beta-N-acetylmuramidase)
VRSGAEAEKWLRAQSTHPTQSWARLCLSAVRQAFGVDYTPASSWPTSDRSAGTAWDRAKFKHPTTDPAKVPKWVPVFFETPGEADHVAFSVGGGRCLSNDFVRDGRIDECAIADIARKWGPLKGWTEDLVGNRVVPGDGDPTPDPVPPKQPTVALRVDGVDLSHYNPDPDLVKFKAAGGKFVYLKATEGTTVKDPTYASRRDRAYRAGVDVGGYHFARPDAGDARTEAQAFLKSAAVDLKRDLVPMLDLEDAGGIDRHGLTTWVGNFVDEIHNQLGVKPVIYTSFDLDDDFGCLLWVARYHPQNEDPRVPAPWKRWDVRQFSNGAIGVPSSAPGVGNVDLDHLRKGLDVADLRIQQAAPAPKPDRGDTLHLQQASMSWRDSDAQTRADFREIFSRKADAVGFTEIYGNEPILRDEAKKAGYSVVTGPSQGTAETAIAVRHPITAQGFTLVNPGVKGRPPHEGHSARHATWVRFDWQDNDVFYAEGHWVTLNHNDSERVTEHAEMSRALAQLVAEHAKGSSIGFCAGDTNMDAETDDGKAGVRALFAEAGLTVIWDELGEYPATHGSEAHGATIDVIASYDPDKRVTGKRAKAWPLLNSDHRQVSAFFDVKPRRQS